MSREPFALSPAHLSRTNILSAIPVPALFKFIGIHQSLCKIEKNTIKGSEYSSPCFTPFFPPKVFFVCLLSRFKIDLNLPCVPLHYFSMATLDLHLSNRLTEAQSHVLILHQRC